jgi:hypothetical protein
MSGRPEDEETLDEGPALAVDVRRVGPGATMALYVEPCSICGNVCKVGRCRLTVSKPVLTAPMVSALEPRIS